MKRLYTLKTRKAIDCDRGYTLLEIAVVLAIMGILGMAGVASLKMGRRELASAGESLALDLESCMSMTSYSPNSYSMAFERGGYTVYRNKYNDIETEKEVVYPENIEFAKIPANISFLKKKDLQLKKEDRTIKLTDNRTGGELYITIVPVSNRVHVTENPSRPF